MKNIKNGYKTLAVAVIKSGYLDGDDYFLSSDWIDVLFELSGTCAEDYSELKEYGEVSKRINLLNAKIKYKQKIGAKCEALQSEYYELLEKRKKIRKINKKVLTNKRD